ncbi:tetratricopeptide repeat protein [Sporosalibacterium faouarense]|uniref:tetratricopeptide repeat protein n=1 Tax=Sporosalibacterium faouarense TaxID=516123 RepID=UPI00192BED03|nr:hypothetical protein [Sporosalibacterium faouarense]
MNNEFEDKLVKMNDILEKVKNEALENSIKTRIDLLEMKAETERNRSDYLSIKRSIELYSEIISLIEQTPNVVDNARKGDIYNHYAIVISTRDIREAEVYYKKAIENIEEDVFKSYSYSNLGLIKLKGKFYSKAVEYFEIALDLNELNLLAQKDLIVALDMRNEVGDIDRAFNLLKNLRTYEDHIKREEFFNLINNYELPNVQKKYAEEIKEIKNIYVREQPELLSSKIQH